MNEQQRVLCMHDPSVQSPLLRHSSVSQDHQIVAALQQTSKELHAAVAAHLAGQLPLVLCPKQLRRMQDFAQWLCKHASLLQSMHLQLPRSYDAMGYCSGRPAAAGIAAALADALQHVAAFGALQLQSFELAGNIVDPGLLQQLPAARLTKLCADVEFSSSASLQAVAGLTGLQHLELRNTDFAATKSAAVTPDDMLAPLAAGLQQLAQLHINALRPAQLQWLPPKLQQLHVTVDLCSELQHLLQLAGWLPQHASTVRSLKLQDGSYLSLTEGWDTALDALAGALQATAAAGAAPSSAAAAAGAAPLASAAAADTTAAPGAPAPSLQLQSLLGGRSAAKVPENLPANTLTELASEIDWDCAAHVTAIRDPSSSVYS
jgi:hypothetical protein